MFLEHLINDKIETDILFSILLFFGPFFIFLIITLIKQKFNQNKILNILFSITSFVLIFLITLYFLLLQFFFLFMTIKTEPINIVEPIYPTIETYKKELEEYSNIPFVVEHFPSSIPDNATDFLCKLRTSASYLTFKTDKNYIDQIINNNKNNILRNGLAENLCIHYIFCEKYHHIKPDDTIYILKNSKNNKNNYKYTSGFVVSNNYDEILFFGLTTNIAKAFHSFGIHHLPKEEYPYIIKLLPFKKHRFQHFPNTLPNNTRNYFFKTESDPHGYNIHHLAIKTDKKYINNLLKKYENKIVDKINFAEISNYYRYIHMEIDKYTENPKLYNVYILKNENNDNDYTSGFVISEEEQKVVFFYANYNLKKIK